MKSLYNKLLNHYVAYLIILGVGLLFVCSFPLAFGRMDHNASLLHGLRLLDPTFIPNDWYTWRDPQMYMNFGYLIKFLGFLGPLPLMFGLLHISLLVAFVVSIYQIIDHLFEQPLLPFITTVVLIELLVTNKYAVGIGIFDWELTPRAIGEILFFLSIASLIRQRYLSCGVFLGLAGFIHANYLFLGPLVIFTAVILNIKCLSLRDIASIAIPLIVISLPMSINVFRNYLFDGHGGLQSKHILSNVRNIMLYNPKKWELSIFTKCFSIFFLGISCFMLRPPEKGSLDNFKSITFSMGLIVLLGGIFTILIYIEPVASILPFGIVPNLLILSLILVGSTMAHLIEKGSRKFSNNKLVSLIIGNIIISMCMLYLSEDIKILLAFSLLLFILFMLTMRFPERINLFKTIYLTGLFMILVIKSDAINRSNIFPFHWRNPPYEVWMSSKSSKLYNWIRNSTDNNSVFIIPPYTKRTRCFRILARRAIVVDYKILPYDEKGSNEWYRRLLLISGLEKGRYHQFNDIKKGFTTIDRKRVRKLVKEFKADYLLIEKNKQKGFLGELPKEFEDEDFLIYKISNLSKPQNDQNDI